MNADEALAFVRTHGVVLVAGKGPVPRLVEAIAGEPIAGSWWAHPQGKLIFATLQPVVGSSDVLVCRLVDGKITLVHRRVWPALVRLAARFPRERLAQVREEHTASGRHETTTVPFPRWVPDAVKSEAMAMGEDEALALLGVSAKEPGIVRRASRRPRRTR
ncbi:MAG TPA: hypothetical protein VLW55_11660 [Burkholderiaceae bacterium]|nr:hypothetical protein [Burkholderiaceae bacterium]